MSSPHNLDMAKFLLHGARAVFSFESVDTRAPRAIFAEKHGWRYTKKEQRQLLFSTTETIATSQFLVSVTNHLIQPESTSYFLILASHPVWFQQRVVLVTLVRCLISVFCVRGLISSWQARAETNMPVSSVGSFLSRKWHEFHQNERKN